MQEKKRFSLVRNGRGQIATEQMMLTGIILLMLIPIIFYITQTQTQTPYMTDTLVVLDNSVESLSNLGSGSSTTVVVQVPTSVVSADFADCNSNGDVCGAIQVDYADGSQDVFEMSYFVQGSLDFLEDPGLHYVTLYHQDEEQNIIFQECGDGVQSGGEQCEVCTIDDDCVGGTCDNGICQFGATTPCLSNACYDPSDQYGCFCQCSNDNECLTNLCEIDAGASTGHCSLCETSADCNPSGGDDYYCDAGVCKSCDYDGDGEESDFYCGGVDCNDDDALINTGATEICTGGIDENCDGLVDCLDGACGFDPACSVDKENECTTGNCCSDNQDNDGDGNTDCNDNDCDLDSACTGECSEGQVLCSGVCVDGDTCGNSCGPSECSGGVANSVCEIGESCLCPDCTGQQDSCASGLTCQISSSGCDVCTDCTGSENSNAFCSDGLDNDCDGFVDCYDADCFGFTGTSGICCVSGGDGVCEGALNQCNTAGTGTNYFLDSCDSNCNLQTGNTCASNSLGSSCVGDVDCDGGIPQNYCPTSGSWCDSGCGEIDRDSSQTACEDSGGNCNAQIWSSSYVCCNGDDGTDNCAVDSDCTGGYLCTGSCQCSTDCNNDNECQYGYFCVNGECSTGGSGAGCTDNSDCSSGYTCDADYNICVACDGNSVQNDPGSNYGYGLCEMGYNGDGTGSCGANSNSDEKSPSACVGNSAYVDSSCNYYSDGDSNLNTCNCIAGAGNYFSSGSGQDKCCGDDSGEDFGTGSSEGWCCINGNKYSSNSLDSTGQYLCLNGALSGCNGNLGGAATSYSSCGRVGGWYCDGAGTGANTWKDQLSAASTPDDCDGGSSDPWGEGHSTNYDGASCEGNRMYNDFSSGVSNQNTGWKCNNWRGPYAAFVDLSQAGSVLTARIEVADEADSYNSGGYAIRLGNYDTITDSGHYDDASYPGSLYYNPSSLLYYSGIDSSEGTYGDYFDVIFDWSNLVLPITQEKKYYLEVGVEESSSNTCSGYTCPTEDPNNNEGGFTTSLDICVPVTYSASADSDCCPIGSNAGDNTYPGIDDDGGNCVSCDSSNKQVLGGTGDGLCESKCGASVACDEKAVNSNWVNGQTCNWCGTTCASNTDNTVGSDTCTTCSNGYQAITSTDLCYSNIACGTSGWAASTYDCDNSDVQGEGSSTAKESEVTSSSCTSTCSGSGCCQIGTATCNAVNSCGSILGQITLDEVTDKTCHNDEGSWEWKLNSNTVVENSALECADGYDNDCDGDFDCDDPGCATSGVCAPQCSDGIDNDNDGYIDYLQDIGCTDNDDDNEVNPSSACTSSNTILRLRSTTNSHTARYDQTSYTNLWCYPYAADNNKPASCNGKEVIRAAFSSNTNAHVEYGYKTTSGYTDVCFSNVGLECVYITGSCPEYHTNIGSISAATNAHAGVVGQYSIKVCCTHFP